MQEARAAVEVLQQEQHERAMAAMEALLGGGYGGGRGGPYI